jgi:hypothetical protein
MDDETIDSWLHATTVTDSNEVPKPLTYMTLADTVTGLDMANGKDRSVFEVYDFTLDGYAHNHKDFDVEEFARPEFYWHSEPMRVITTPSFPIGSLFSDDTTPYTRHDLRIMRKLARDAKSKKKLKEMSRIPRLFDQDPRRVKRHIRKIRERVHRLTGGKTTVSLYKNPDKLQNIKKYVKSIDIS